jgi:hypothetical protein
MNNWWDWIVLATCVIAVTTILLNKKVRVWDIFKAQLKILTDDRTKKTSLLDILDFFLIPGGLSAVIVFYFRFTIKDFSGQLIMAKDLPGELITASSIIFALLMGFSAMLVTKECYKENKNPGNAILEKEDKIYAEKMEQLKNNTLGKVSMAMVLSFFSLIIYVLIYAITFKYLISLQIFSLFGIWMSISTCVYLLSIVQCLFEIYHPGNN